MKDNRGNTIIEKWFRYDSGFFICTYCLLCGRRLLTGQNGIPSSA